MRRASSQVRGHSLHGNDLRSFERGGLRSDPHAQLFAYALVAGVGCLLHERLDLHRRLQVVAQSLLCRHLRAIGTDSHHGHRLDERRHRLVCRWTLDARTRLTIICSITERVEIRL